MNAIETLGLNDAAIVAHYTNARMVFLCLHHIFSPCTTREAKRFPNVPPYRFQCLFSIGPEGQVIEIGHSWWISAEDVEFSTQKLESSWLLERG